jgi:hypothetical protein
MNIRLSLLAAWSLLLACGKAGFALDPLPVGNQTVLEAVNQTFRDKKTTSFTLQDAHDIEFFPHSNKLFDDPSAWNPFFQTVGDPRKSSGKTLELGGTDAKLGDIVMIASSSGKDPANVLVYLGERAFNDTGDKHSFFAYLYLSRLEYNTYPPRLHSQLVKKVGLPDTDDDTSATPVFQFWKSHAQVLLPDARTKEEGTWHWLRLADDPPVFFPSKSWKKQPSYQVVRARGASTGPLVLFLKDVGDMPVHHQTNNFSTCFWAAYTDCIFYHYRSDSEYDISKCRKYELALLNRIFEKATPEQKNKLEQYFLSHSNLVSGPDDPKAADYIKNKEHWAYWLCLDENQTKVKTVLHLHYHDPANYTNFLAVVEQVLQADHPVLINSSLWDYTPIDDDPAFADTPDQFAPPIRTVKPGNWTQAAGHGVTIIGMKRDKSAKVFLYFQDGLSVGDEKTYTPKLDDRSVFKMEAKLFWRHLVRHGNAQERDKGNDPLLTESGKRVPPMWHFAGFRKPATNP